MGLTAGAGVEKALTPAWSVRLEYDYTNFGSADIATPASFLQAVPAQNLYFRTGRHQQRQSERTGRQAGPETEAE